MLYQRTKELTQSRASWISSKGRFGESWSVLQSSEKCFRVWVVVTHARSAERRNHVEALQRREHRGALRRSAVVRVQVESFAIDVERFARSLHEPGGSLGGLFLEHFPTDDAPGLTGT